MRKLFLLIILCGCCFFACQESTTTTPPVTQTPPPTKMPEINYPVFNAETAMGYIQKQVDFGPRVPGTPTHKECADWLEASMKKYADKVMVQSSEVTVYTGQKVPMYNIISSFNPDAKERIMLSAHWDTRPFADQDTERIEEPIEGANDGASGVGVLMELAKVLKANPVEIGIDIIFWDVEDYGRGTSETYCLGSQYWSKNKHVAGYDAKYGILLDMVGAKNAVFYQEGHSMKYARNIVDKVWKAAHKSGYRSYFPFQRVNPITDDHYFINLIAGIPTIDIIQYDQFSEKGFFPHWHTHEDSMDKLSTKTLKAVGQTLVRVLYDENAS